ncbi:OPT family small oligopeptide transporter [Hortaea werneckii]|nr:OPT family small oligopeptide transporter [Hortaea werneckii]
MPETKTESIFEAQALGDASSLQRSHQNDPNLPIEDIETLNEAVKTNNVEEALEEEDRLTRGPPYEAVRAAVPAAGINMFLSMRSPAITIPTVVILLLVYPVGCLWAKVMPTRKSETLGIEWTLNTGPFTIKEHTVITLMANVTAGYAYSTDALLALKAKPLYNLDMGWGCRILFTSSSQVIGIALAGVFRRFLVWPAALIWPANLSITTLLYALHDKSKSDPAKTSGWQISRYRFFVYVAFGSFIYYWSPGVIWQCLSVFSFVTWIKPKDATINQLFGGFTGLSLIPLTFDWTYVTAYLQDPLLSTTFSHLNTLIGLGMFVILTTFGISYTGALDSYYLPINTFTTFDNTQSQYDVSKVLGSGYSLDLAKYKKYSPMFLAPTFALNYGLSFAALIASIVHTIVYHRRGLWARFRLARQQEPNDVHMRLMSKYREAPDWCYAALFVLGTAFGLATVLGYSSQLPWWAYFVSLFFALVFIIPCCMILGITNIMLSLNVISPYLAGFMIPGKPIGVMIFKVYSTIVLGQAQTYSQDLKLAHYMKVPPRITFWAQVVMTLWASIVQVAVMNWTLGSIDGVCSTEQKSHFTCPNGRTFFSSSITWGVVGPQRMFGAGSIYASFNYFWLVGALLPVAFFVLNRVFPYRRLRFLHAPVMLGAMAWLPPATPLFFTSWAFVGLLFNYWIRKRWNGWWSTYNYITAAALDSGLIIATLVIFFAITLPEVTVPQWWGNVQVFETMDSLGTAIRKTVTDGETFGPKQS